MPLFFSFCFYSLFLIFPFMTMPLWRTPLHLNIVLHLLQLVGYFTWYTWIIVNDATSTLARAGEVGKEMYIVNRGRLQVVTDNGKTVMASLKAGCYFGEISILNMGTAGKELGKYRSPGGAYKILLYRSNSVNISCEHETDITDRIILKYLCFNSCIIDPNCHQDHFLGPWW